MNKNYKTVYQTGHSGIFVGAVEAHEDPLEPGNFLVPGGCVDVSPPEIPAGMVAKWTGKKWSVVEDHRGEEGYVDGEWRKIHDVGPLPAGWSDTLPAPSATETRQREILTTLRHIDDNTIRPERSIRLLSGRGDLTEEEAETLREDHIILDFLEQQAAALRAELREVEAALVDEISEKE